MNAERTATLFGGRKITATFEDGSTRKEVFVRQVPVRLMPEYLRLIDDEPERIELCTGLTSEEVDNLTPDSHTALVAAIEEVNGASFFAWLRRRVQRQEQLAPGSSGELGKALLSNSTTGSQSARSAAA